MDSASCSVYELIGNIQDDNTEYGAILNEYLEDIEIKLDIIYERNVNVSRCSHMFAPLYNTLWGMSVEYIQGFFISKRRRRCRIR